MPYVGRDLQRGNYLKLDDISSSFDGSTTTFNLTSGGNAFFPGSAFSIIVSLGGVIQEPESAFQIDRSQIIFATAPSPNDDFFCIVQGVALGVGVPGHNTVNNDHLAKPLSYGDYFRWDSANNRVGINTLLPSTALDVVGSATFSGNVSIGGTLTYEDVANIDAVGIITAQSGIEDKTLTIGHVVFAGTNKRLSGDSNLFYDNDNDRLGISTNNPQNTLEVVGTGVSVFNEAKNSGVDVHGAGKIELIRSDSVAYIDFKTSYSEDFDCRIQQVNNGLRFYTGGQVGNTTPTEKFRISSAGNLGINQSAPAYKLVINELDTATGTAHTMLSALNPVVYIDVGNEIDHNIVLKKHETNAQDEVGGLLFASSPDGANYNWAGIKAIEDANATVTDIAFFTAPSNSSGANSQERVRIHNTNVGIGTTDPEALLHIFQNNATVGHDLRIEQKGSGDSVLGFTLTGTRAYAMGIDSSDANKFKFATGSDLTTNTFVTITSDGLIGIGQPTPATTLEIKSDANAQTTATIPTLRITNDDGSASLNDITGSVEFHTEDSSDPNHISGFMRNISETNAGVNYSLIFGTKDANIAGDATEKLRIQSNGLVNIGTGLPEEQLTIRNTTQHCLIRIISKNDASAGIDFGDPEDTDIGRVRYYHSDGSNTNFMRFDVNASERLRIDNAGNVLPGASNTQDLGSTSKEFRHLYLGDSGSVKLGLEQDAQIFHDGSNLYLKNDTNNIILKNNSADYLRGVSSDGSVELLQNAAIRLKTTAAGIEVTGKVVASGEVETAQDYPNFRPRLDLNFSAEKKLDSSITYFRSGPASFVNEFGKVVLVGGNAPRFDHDPMTGECKGLLIEESRTNYVRVSTNLESEWVAGSGSFAVDNSVTNPDGSVGAYYHTGAELYHQNIDLSGASTNIITVSLWVKERSGQSGTLDIQIYQQISGSLILLGAFTFNPATATIGTLDANFSDGTVQEYPNGWYRVSAKVTTDSGNFSSSTRYDIQGAEHYVWGMQLEVGEFLTSFIPTRGSTATRGYEAVTLEGTEFSDVFGTDFNEFSLVADYDNTQTVDGTGHAIIDLWGEVGNYDNRIEWFKNSASPYHLATRSFGQGNPTFANGTPTAGSKAKTQRFATSWYVPDYSNTSSRRFVVSTGGEAVDVINDSSGTTVPLITRMGIGCNPTRLDFSPGLLHFKRLMVYNKTLSDGQLQNLSAQ